MCLLVHFDDLVLILECEMAHFFYIYLIWCRKVYIGEGRCISKRMKKQLYSGLSSYSSWPYLQELKMLVKLDLMEKRKVNTIVNHHCHWSLIPSIWSHLELHFYHLTLFAANFIVNRVFFLVSIVVNGLNKRNQVVLVKFIRKRSLNIIHF